METPAAWNDDPACEHLVACKYQTHYCTYIRVPKLLTLQPAPKNSDELIFVVAMQARELWMRVILRDIAALREANVDANEAQKLLRRDIEIVKLLELQSDVAETILPRAPIALRGQSAQLTRLMRATRALPRDDAAREFAAHLRAWRARDAKWIRVSERGRAYEKYLRVNELLELQNAPKMDWAEVRQSPTALSVPEKIGADETMFVVVHQAFELWFKAILDIVDRAIAFLRGDNVAEAMRLMRRAVAIQKLLAQQIHIPATMSPHDFLAFRSETKIVDGKKMWRGLSPASGTESYQFRELEIASGLNANPTYQEFLRGHVDLTTRFLTATQAKRMAQPSLADVFNQLLARRGITDVIEIFAPRRQADLADLADALLEYDEFFYLWRVNHIVMLQRMIGEKPGTGYLGLGYLKETAGLAVQGVERIFHQVQKRPRFFENLWHARSRFKV
jgi:tryptophan 2,3-dioxygenase